MARTMWISLCAALLACSGDKETEDPTTDPVERPSDLVFEDVNNYAFSSSFVIGAVPVAPQTELTVDWSDVTMDIRGREVDPASIQQILLTLTTLDQQGVLEAINNNALSQQFIDQVSMFRNTSGRTSASVTEFSLLGNPFNPETMVADASRTWLVSAANQDGARYEFLMNTIIVPTDDNGNDTVSLTNDSAELDFTPDLRSADPLYTAAAAGPYTLDWSGATEDAYGRSLDFNLLNRLVIGHVAIDDLAEVEAIFLQLYEQADQLYTADIGGLTSIDLTEARSATGEAFPGFTAGGTWVVALECTRADCTNPAPLLLAVVDVE